TGAVAQRAVAPASPRLPPPEQVPGLIVRRQPPLPPERAGDAVLVLESEDPSVHVRPGYQSTAMYLVSVNSSSPSCAPSRPSPDCFTPPNGAAGSDTTPRLMATMPP